MPKKVRNKKESSKSWKPAPDNGKPPIFVHSNLDEYGLDIYEFRVLAHVARRASKEQGCFTSQAKMAKICGLSQRKVLEVLKVLCGADILKKERSSERRTNVYRINPCSQWKLPSELDEVRKKAKEPQKKNSKLEQIATNWAKAKKKGRSHNKDWSPNANTY